MQKLRYLSTKSKVHHREEKTMTKAYLGLLSCALIAGLCTAAPAPAAAAPKICPTLYAPVCAVTRKGVRETFANSCLAQQAHARILHDGRCIGPICISFKQVCARVPGHKPQTFASVCAAEQANATVLHDGACKK
jgi:hypothetical protein